MKCPLKVIFMEGSGWITRSESDFHLMVLLSFLNSLFLCVFFPEMSAIFNLILINFTKEISWSKNVWNRSSYKTLKLCITRFVLEKHVSNELNELESLANESSWVSWNVQKLLLCFCCFLFFFPLQNCTNWGQKWKQMFLVEMSKQINIF